MSKVPKFGAWEGNQGEENFTVYFDKARQKKNNGPKINPNDPEENPDLYEKYGGGSAQAQPAPSQTRANVESRPQARPQVQAPVQARARADEQRKHKQGGSSVAENGPQDRGQAQTQAKPKAGPQEGRAKVPQFGAWNGGGEGTQYTAYFDKARKTKNVVGEPVMNRDVGDKGRAQPAATQARSEVKDDVPRNETRKSSSSVQGSDGLAKQPSVPKTPVHPKVQPRTGGGRPNHAAGVPTFGAWNNDPSQAEGYTVAFTRAREERHTPNNAPPPSYNQQPHDSNNQKQASCCSIL